MDQTNSGTDSQICQSNVPLPAEALDRIRKAIGGETLLYTVVSDLSMRATYGGSFFAATDKAIYSFGEPEEEPKRRTYSDFSHASVKRCYGNALLVLSREEETEPENFIRFSLKVASLFDAVALCCEKMVQGEPQEDCVAIVNEAFVKQKSVCPKCGRPYTNRSKICSHCTDTRGNIRRLLKVAASEKYKILLSTLMILATAGLNVLIPRLNAVMVDDYIKSPNPTVITGQSFALVVLGLFLANQVA